MKNLYTILLLSICFSLNAQWVTIPDPEFVDYLNNTNVAQTCMNGNLLDTTCAELFTKTYIDCRFRGITDLTGVRFFKNATSLNCEGNNLTFLPELPPLLVSLDTRDNHNLDSITSFPIGLEYAGFYYNALTHLPTLPNGLKELILTLNDLTSLPALPDSLNLLVVTNNELTALPTFPSTLRVLECSGNYIAALPSLPAILVSLNCSDNQLTSLPALPDSLEYLLAGENKITALPALPAKLDFLEVYNDSLAQLPPLPAGLTRLFCSNNPFQVSLPALPSALTELECYACHLTSLPPLPNGLRSLACHNNQISTIDTFPRSLKSIYIGDNPLTQIPTLPDTMTDFSFSNIQNLTCLPRLTTIYDMYFPGTDIDCLPNYGSVAQSNPPLSTIPLCGIYNLNNCPVYWNISGQAYFDSLANCTFGLNDTGLHNAKLSLISNGAVQQQIFAGAEGLYSFDALNVGNYTVAIDTAGLPFDLVCPPSGSVSSIITAADPFDSLIDFSVRCKPGFDLSVGSILRSWGQFFPGDYSHIRFSAGDVSNFWGANCAQGLSGQITLTYSGPATYISNSGPVMPASVNGNTITWNIADFGNVSFSNSFYLVFKTDTTAQSGQQVCFDITVTPGTGDNNPGNNALSNCFTVVNSYDPNEKEVYPAGNIATAQEWLTYTIHFQNTGNAPAHNIYVDDTLDTDINESTFQLLAYSHQPVVQVKKSVVRFNFPNINLADSNTNEPASHGYVQYKVKLKNNLPIGTAINNTAYIYFDFNTPVVTNTAVNTIAQVNDVMTYKNLSHEFSIYPNPAYTMLNIKVEGFQPASVAVYDINGRKIAEQKYSPQLDVSMFVPGLYVIEVKSLNGIARKRFVKM